LFNISPNPAASAPAPAIHDRLRVRAAGFPATFPDGIGSAVPPIPKGLPGFGQPPDLLLGRPRPASDLFEGILQGLPERAAIEAVVPAPLVDLDVDPAPPVFDLVAAPFEDSFGSLAGTK
jgi:hypothetical protein